MLANMINFFLKINVYKEMFEPEFLKVSETYFTNEAQSLIANFEIKAYMTHVETRLHQEAERVNACMDKSTKEQIIPMLQRIFVSENLEVIISNGFQSLLEALNITDLKRLYYLLDMVKKVDYLKETFKFFIKGRGATISNQDENVIESLLELRHSLEAVVSQAFNADHMLRNTMLYAFEDIMNMKVNRLAELTSKYIDVRLKKAVKQGQEEKEIENSLDEVMFIFKSLHAKDIFEEFYTRRLIKRLLLGPSASTDLEKSMIEKFKSECGPNFTRRADDIFRDIDISKSYMEEFKNYVEAKKAAGIPTPPYTLYVHIFSVNSWPLPNQQIPKFFGQFSGMQELFTEFYKSRNDKVILWWQHETSTCELIAHFKERYTLVVSFLQGVILTLFNLQKSYKYKDICDILGIGEIFPSVYNPQLHQRSRRLRRTSSHSRS
eukprot:TRINITY_DN3364_c0_g1_i7.p1 TRINITY_DN3364_c0_g1~~TRINITY_DN3364_c0_g1_i7.p1  ORF type:complete len:436 (-),score=155.69 TRINITY_DN3364_c0_g1_i7:601-1908(-)